MAGSLGGGMARGWLDGMAGGMAGGLKLARKGDLKTGNCVPAYAGIGMGLLTGGTFFECSSDGLMVASRPMWSIWLVRVASCCAKMRIFPSNSARSDSATASGVVSWYD